MTIEELHDYIEERKDKKFVVLVRGVPGSGKSTIAKELAQRFGLAHYEADMYFIDNDGNYNFDYEQIKSAHLWCKYSVDVALQYGKNVVVSNTFVKWFEIQPYYDLAQKHGHTLIIVQATGDYQNVHGVPEETLNRMRKNFEVDHNDFVIGT